MNVMIVGCGKVGRTLARQLNEDGNNVTVVDLSEEKVRNFASRQQEIDDNPHKPCDFTINMPFVRFYFFHLFLHEK